VVVTKEAPITGFGPVADGVETRARDIPASANPYGGRKTRNAFMWGWSACDRLLAGTLDPVAFMDEVNQLEVDYERWEEDAIMRDRERAAHRATVQRRARRAADGPETDGKSLFSQSVA